MPQTKKQHIGAMGEEAAVKFLSSRGYAILERNFRVKQGEVDIIARHLKSNGETLCFVEVKTRSDQSSGGMAERAADGWKFEKVSRAAKVWCLHHDIDTDRTAIQFEQVSVYVDRSSGKEEILHYEIPA